MAIPVEVPTLGESVTQATILSWHKNDGDVVAAGDPICELETDKANVDIPAPASGVIQRSKQAGETVKVGEVIAQIDPAGVGSAKPATAPVVPAAQPSAAPAPSKGGSRVEDSGPAVQRLVEENNLDPAAIPATGREGRLTKGDVLAHMAGGSPTAPAQRPGNGNAAAPIAPRVEPPPAPAPAARPAPAPKAPAAEPAGDFDSHGERRVPMSKIRKRIADNLVRAQSVAAILTTFNEVDMSAVMELRGKWKDQFEKVHGVGLGFMSFFARAVVTALGEFPSVNAFIDDEEIVYHRHVHLGIAVSTERGLAVPVLKNAQDMSFAKIESEIKRLANATRDGKLGLEELSGGTFTITNGGVFGSLLSTPILNPPQSGILGMHTIQKRPVAINDKVEIRPMMYLALSYDHRIVDGREAIGFLVRIKQLLEDPARMILEV